MKKAPSRSIQFLEYDLARGRGVALAHLGSWRVREGFGSLLFTHKRKGPYKMKGEGKGGAAIQRGAYSTSAPFLPRGGGAPSAELRDAGQSRHISGAECRRISSSQHLMLVPKERPRRPRRCGGSLVVRVDDDDLDRQVMAFLHRRGASRTSPIGDNQAVVLVHASQEWPGDLTGAPADCLRDATSRL